MSNFVDLRKVDGNSYVESFIESYLDLIKEHSFKELYDEYSWGIMTPGWEDDDPDEEQKIFVIEDVEKWFNTKAGGWEKEKWTNKDVDDLFYRGIQNHKYGNEDDPVTHGELQEYKGVKYMRVEKLFFMCETYLIELNGKVYSIWY